VNVLCTDRESVGYQTAETGGIQHSAAADDLACGETGILDKGVGEDVNGVADDDIDRVGTVACDLGSDLAHQLGIDACQLQTGLAGLSADTGGDDHDVRACRIGIIPCENVQGGGEGGTVNDIHSFAFCFGTIDIDQHDLGSEAVLSQGVSYGSTYVSDTEDGNFLAHVVSPYFAKQIFYDIILSEFFGKIKVLQRFCRYGLQMETFLFRYDIDPLSTKKRGELVYTD